MGWRGLYSLHPLSDFSAAGPSDVPILNKLARVKLVDLILYEFERSFPIELPKDRVIAATKAKFPSFHRGYKSIFYVKYGLDETTYDKFSNLIVNSQPHSPLAKAAKNLLTQWLCAYQEVKLIEEARTEAEKRGGFLVYLKEDGTLSFEADHNNQTGNNSSPANEAGRELIKRRKEFRETLARHYPHQFLDADVVQAFISHFTFDQKRLRELFEDINGELDTLILELSIDALNLQGSIPAAQAQPQIELPAELNIAAEPELTDADGVARVLDPEFEATIETITDKIAQNLTLVSQETAEAENISDAVIAASIETALAEQQIGPSKLDGWLLKDVPGDGNCFYYALTDQLKLKLHAFINSVPHGTAIHDSLRLLVQGDHFSDQEWTCDQEIATAAEKLNAIIGIVDTRYPDTGYVYYYTLNEEKIINPDSSENPLPKNQSIIHLAHTSQSICLCE